MAGPFAPVLSEPGTANVQPVQTTLPKPALAPNGLLTDAVGAIGQGLDIFTKFKKEADSRAIDKELEALSQSTADLFIDGNIKSSDSDPETDDPDEALPTEAQGEFDRLQRLKEGVKQGVVSNDTYLLKAVTGVRKIKALFPRHLRVIDARARTLFGFSPTTALIERALAPEKADEARISQQRDLDFAAGSTALDKNGKPAALRLPGGGVDVEGTVAAGRKIRSAAADAEIAKKLTDGIMKDLQISIAKNNRDAAANATATKVAEIEASNVLKRFYKDSYNKVIGVEVEATLQTLSNQGLDITPEVRRKLIEGAREKFRQLGVLVGNAFDLSTLPPEVREEFRSFVTEHQKPFLDALDRHGMVAVKAVKDSEAAVRMKLSENPRLWAALNAGPAGAKLLEVYHTLNAAEYEKIVRAMGEAGKLSEDDVARVGLKILKDPNALATMTPQEAQAGLKIVAAAAKKLASDRSTPLDAASGLAYANILHNLAAGSALLPNAKDRLQAASYFSHPDQVARVQELNTIDPNLGKAIGTDAIYVVNEGIAAAGRELRSRPGFGEDWTVVFDNSTGGFVSRTLKPLPGLPLGGEDTPLLGGPDITAGQFIITREERDTIRTQMSEATAMIVDMNMGLNASEGYSDLDETFKGMTGLQVREVIASGAHLESMEGTASNFKTPKAKSELVTKVTQRFANKQEVLIGTLRLSQAKGSLLDQATAAQAAIAAQQATASEPQIVRRRYDPVTKVWSAVE